MQSDFRTASAFTVFTSTVSPELLAWVHAEAKRTKRTHRDVLEEALMRYRDDIIRARIRKDLSREDHAEMLEMAEWGMDDYATQLGEYA